MKHIYKLLALLLLSKLSAFGQSAPATNYMNLGGANVNVGVGFTNASAVYPRYPLSFPNVLGDKISLWNTNPAAPNAPHYGLGVQGARFQLFAPATSDNIVFGIGSSANFTENVRFTGDGNVGIGTTSPTLAGLVVDRRIGATNAIFGSTTTGVSIESNFPGVSLNGYWNSGRKAIASGFVGGMGFNPTTGVLSLYTSFSSANAANAPINAPDRLVILSNGNVGIGVGTPVRKLDVSGNTRIVGDGSAPSLDVIGGVKLLTGDQGEGKILTSDADGDARWEKSGYGAVSFTITPAGYPYPNPYDLSNGATPQLIGVETMDDDNRYANGNYTVGQSGYYLLNGSIVAELSTSLNHIERFTYTIQVLVNNTNVRAAQGYTESRYLSSDDNYRYKIPAILNTIVKCNSGDVITLKLSGSVTGSGAQLDDCRVDMSQFTFTKL